MQLTPAIQEALLALLCYHADAPLIAALLTPDTYDPFFRDIAAAATDYLSRYSQPPGEHTLDLIGALKAQHPDRAEIYQRIFESLKQTRKGVNRDYILGQASLFARHQRLKAGITAAIDELSRGEQASIAEAEQH